MAMLIQILRWYSNLPVLFQILLAACFAIGALIAIYSSNRGARSKSSPVLSQHPLLLVLQEERRGLRLSTNVAVSGEVSCTIRSSSDYDIETLQQYLAASGFSVTGARGLSSSGALLYLQVAIGSVGGLGAFSAILIAFIHRHRGKEAHVYINGELAILKDYSEKEVEKIIAMLERRGHERTGTDSPEAHQD